MSARLLGECSVFLMILPLLFSGNVLADPDDQNDVNRCSNAPTGVTLCHSQFTAFKLPGNFDVSLLHPNVTHLTIRSTHGSNVVYTNFTAFPLRQALTKVYLYHFNQWPEDPRFPLGELFGGNKYHLRGLYFDQVKLLTLEEADFRGFNKLEDLVLDRCSLSAISPHVFDGLGRLPTGQPALPDYKPVLADVLIRRNDELTSLDWAFLKPISRSVKQVRLSSNNIENLTCSAPFILAQIEWVDLTENRQDSKTWPENVYRTFNASFVGRLVQRKYSKEGSA